jgi:hypothetical protein
LAALSSTFFFFLVPLRRRRRRRLIDLLAAGEDVCRPGQHPRHVTHCGGTARHTFLLLCW